jgi:hypothetical protein
MDEKPKLRLNEVKYKHKALILTKMAITRMGARNDRFKSSFFILHETHV